jgi:EAL domain-containing protein (putative c-di-GMP-specific phosphodiesterase class I)
LERDQTKEQLEFLVKHGCDEGQGFYFSPAIPPENIKDKLV